MANMLGPENPRVRLTVDLTKYHPSLVKGVIGVVVEPPTTRLARRTPHVFMTVRFPEHTLDVLRRKGIEGVDAHRDWWDLLRQTCTRAVRLVGPRGGFRSLTVESRWSDGVPKREIITNQKLVRNLEGFLRGETDIRVETEVAD